MASTKLPFEEELKLNDGNVIPAVSGRTSKYIGYIVFSTECNTQLTAIKLGYGLGTANYKADPNSPVDKELVKTVVTAIKAGYYHLDGAQG